MVLSSKLLNRMQPAIVGGDTGYAEQLASEAKFVYLSFHY